MRLFCAVLCACSGTLVGFEQPDSLPSVLKKSGAVRNEIITLPGLKAGTSYSLLYSVHTPRVFGAESRVRVQASQGDTVLVHKTLHLGDPDLYAMFHVPHDGAAQLKIDVAPPLAAPARYRLVVNRWPGSRNLKREPNGRWQDALQIALGETVFASGDEAPYIPLPGNPSQDEDWYRIDFQENAPKLVFFQIELMERDNIPVDVSVHRVMAGQPVAYNDGEDPVTLPHEVQALPGNKFTTRVLKERGAYYIRVRANHPEYKLRTRVYDPPPYQDPRRAVQTAVDYIMGAGDSWHANTPRRGGIFDRVSNVHQETSLCVACHPTHFSQRAQLYAAQRGYQVHQRQQLQFLAERFYNNPRPFYGFEEQGAVWARVISAPANVLSRMSVLLDLFEKEVSGERRDSFHRGVAEYLRLYYKNREKLPPDETNGNTPLVSTYEVAWYSWRVTRDERIARLIEQDDIKNMVDLCYQTLALADIDAARHAAKIRRNAERILSLQRPSGQWAMRFEPDQPEVEFQTGHALWALHAAGVPADHPRVAKTIQYLMRRQQPFGGWMDPLQSYENFRTPFRETQMAVLALSSYFPAGARRAGWDSQPESQDTLPWLDAQWDRPAPEALRRLLGAASSDEVLIRQQAVEALGRLADPATLPTLVASLGDASKLVQRTAAWAVRQVYSRHEQTPLQPLLAALASRDDRTRWGATRVFATHFAALARRPELARSLRALVADPVPPIRMQALKGLWQFWFWSPHEDVKSLIEDAFLDAMAQPQHPWVDRNLREGIYNIADENIRYLYNNWVPLLARAEDRERAVRGRLAIEARLSEKFSQVLEKGSEAQRKMLLTGLTEFHLRRGDVYQHQSSGPKSSAPAYNRIGNDIEQSVFFGESNGRFARALLPLLDSPDPEMRRRAASAALLSREASFPEVKRLAGVPGPARERLMSRLPPEIARIFRPPAPQAKARAAARTRHRKPDEAYFRAYVQPILETRGADGYACVHCHATHTIFNGTYSSALNVVDTDDPENSLILRKPTSSAESEGTLGAKTLSHGGGIRWEKNSPEYRAILEWIKGAGQ